jgi:hypothetical protein
MDKKRIFMILAAVGIVGLLACITLGTLLGRFLNERESKVLPTVIVTDITACVVDPSVLCVVSFGADNVNRMVINFQLPSEDYGDFYVKVRYDEAVSVYPCQAVEGIPTSVFCTGERVPLGQTIDVQVYSTDGDVLLAQGTLLVGSVALPTAVQITMTPTATITPTPGPETPTPQVTPTRTPKVYP